MNNMKRTEEHICGDWKKMCKQKTFSDCAYCTKTKAFFLRVKVGYMRNMPAVFFAMARSRSTDLSELLATAENFVSM